MRLVILSVALIACAQPALAREGARHHRHHHHARVAHQPAAWGEQNQWFGAQPYVYDASGNAVRVSSRRAQRAQQVQQTAWGWNDGSRQQPAYGTQSYASTRVAREAAPNQYDAMIARHASANGVPEALVRRVIVRESRYNPGIVGRGGAMGMMQIKLATARGMGYTGSAAGLLDPETNLTYAVRYLAGAYQVAGGNADAAVGHYARGYYYAAKRQGLTNVAAASQAGWNGAGYASSWTQPQPARYRAAREAAAYTPAESYGRSWWGEESSSAGRRSRPRRG